MKKNYDPSLNHEKKKKGFLRVPDALPDGIIYAGRVRYKTKMCSSTKNRLQRIFLRFLLLSNNYTIVSKKCTPVYSLVFGIWLLFSNLLFWHVV